MRIRNEPVSDGVIYISGVMDEETRPVIFSALNELNPGEGMLVIFRLPKGESSDKLLEFSIDDFSPSKTWDCVSDRVNGGELQGTVLSLAEQVNERRLPNIVFSQGDEKVKATDEHTVCFGVMGGPKSGKITKIKTIVHQQLNMGLNGDLLLHESNLIMGALYNTGVIVKDAPLSVKSYGAGGSSSHKVHPGDILTSDAVIDIRTHVHPRFILNYLENYLTELDLAFPRGFDDIFSRIRQRFETGDPSYSGLSIVSDIEELISMVSRTTGTEVKDILDGMSPEEKEYYGEISISNSSQGTRVIKRITNPSFLGDEGQKEAKRTIVSYMNRMGAYEKNKSQAERIRDKLEKITKKEEEKDPKDPKDPKEVWRRVLRQLVEISKLRRSFREVAERVHYKSLEEKKEALKQDLGDVISKREVLLGDEDLESECRLLRSEIARLREIQSTINPRRPFVITASGNVFFNHAEKESVHQFGAVLVEMENQLFKQTIHKAITDGCYIQSELITKIAADPVCIPAEVTAELNTWASQCSMTLDDYVSAYMWASTGKKQDMQNIPSCGLWPPANKLVTTQYPCGIIHIDANPLEMSHEWLKELLGNTPSYIVYHDKFFYANELMDIEDLGSATEETRALIATLRIPYIDDGGGHLKHSLFTEISAKRQDEIDRVTKHRHRATYERLFYTLSVPYDASSLSETEDDASSVASTHESQILNPFWKEIGVDLLSEIGNGKAFSGSIFNNPTEDDRKIKDELRSRASGIASSPVNRDAISALFRDYLTYMTSKIPEDELKRRGISAENAKYPMYARNALYKTGYVSGPVKDWDAAIYKSNNSAVLVGVVDSFLKDEPVSSIGPGAMIIYNGPNHDDHLSEISESCDDLEEGMRSLDEPFPIPLTLASLLGAMDLLLNLQNYPDLAPHHQASLSVLVNTLLEEWDKVSKLPPESDYQQSLSIFCIASKKAIDKVAEEFRQDMFLFSLIRPVLNWFFQVFNLLQRLIFSQPAEMRLFEKGPNAEQRKQWHKIHGAIEELWKKCLEPIHSPDEFQSPPRGESHRY